jgi:L-fucose isomerase-like protein
MAILDKKMTFGVIVGTRGFFNPRLAVEGRREVLARLSALGYSHVILPAKATAHQAVETRADAKKCAALFQQHRDRIDGVIVVLPNFGDELGIVETLDLARLDVPVLVQACSDRLDAVKIGRASFTDTRDHTCDIGSDAFGADLDFFARVCRVVRGLRRARIGAVGARPAAFQTVRFSEKLLQDSGITVVPVDLSEIISQARQLDDRAKSVQKRLSEIRNYGSIPARVDPQAVLKQAKLSVVLERWMAENELNASAVQCWTSIQNNYGCAACLSMSLMGEKRMPSACEVDVVGAVSMYALLLASGQIPGFLDWNNNYADAADKCVCTHCSNFPKSFMGRQIGISELDVLGESLGRENCFGAVKGHVAAGPMTYFRMSTDDRRGKIKTYLGEGQFTGEPFDMDGGIAVCQIPRLRELMGYMCQNGFEHHVAMTRTHCAGVLYEAITKYLGWDLYYHG